MDRADNKSRVIVGIPSHGRAANEGGRPNRCRGCVVPSQLASGRKCQSMHGVAGLQRHRHALDPGTLLVAEMRRQRMAALAAGHVQDAGASWPGETTNRSDAPERGVSTRGT